MCGILGVVQRREPVDAGAFATALATLDRRGPDQEGVYFDGNVALGHKRLSILDLSEAGRQPMSDPAGNAVIVFNGEIYNHLEIKAELAGRHEWRSRSDTEVLLRACGEWGQGVLSRIEGMFAFAVYDKAARSIFLARDHFGKKPLYYYLDEERFAFASEMKALLRIPQIRAAVTIDRRSLAKYLVFGYVPSPHSVFAQIRKLEPATAFVFDVREWRIRDHARFWRLEDVPLNESLTEDAVLSETAALIEKAVVKRLRSDVPVGVFLSGGVDSSLVSAYVARHAPALEAFTVAYRASPGSDESGYAMRAAAGVGIRQHLCNLEGESVLSSFLEMLEYLDEPMADAAIIPLYFVAKFAREKVTVVLSGDGGDELFAGYGKHAAQVWLERLGPVRGALQAGKRWFRRGSAARKLAACATLPFAARQFLFGSGGPTLDEAATLMGQGDLLVGDVFEDALACDAAFRQKDVLNRSLYLDCRILLPDGYLVKADRATMANSLEMRNPLLDRALAEFAFSIPGGFKMRMGQTKRILKRLAARHVDRSCVYRRKSGFMSPLSHWTRHELRDLTEDSVAAAADLLDAGRVRRLLRDHMDGRLDARFVVLRLLNLGFFLKRWARGG